MRLENVSDFEFVNLLNVVVEFLDINCNSSVYNLGISWLTEINPRSQKEYLEAT